MSDLERIFPILKTRASLRQNSGSLKERDAGHVFVQTSVPPLHPSAADVDFEDPFICYGIGRGECLEMITKEKMQTLGIGDMEALHRIAIDNLLTRLSNQEDFEIFTYQDGPHHAITGFCASALLLVGNIWRRDFFDVEEDFVASIPERDTLLLTDSARSRNIVYLKKWAAQVARQADPAQVLMPQVRFLIEAVEAEEELNP